MCKMTDIPIFCIFHIKENRYFWKIAEGDAVGQNQAIPLKDPLDSTESWCDNWQRLVDRRKDVTDRLMPKLMLTTQLLLPPSVLLMLLLLMKITGKRKTMLTATAMTTATKTTIKSTGSTVIPVQNLSLEQFSCNATWFTFVRSRA